MLLIRIVIGRMKKIYDENAYFHVFIVGWSYGIYIIFIDLLFLSFYK